MGVCQTAKNGWFKKDLISILKNPILIGAIFLEKNGKLFKLGQQSERPFTQMSFLQISPSWADFEIFCQI
jgi:hypothetical protein